MKKTPFLPVETEIETIKAMSGVIDCVIDDTTGFQLITVLPGTDYHGIASALNTASIEPRNFFIKEGEEYVQFNRDNNAFTKVDLEAVTAARWHTQHTKALVSELGKRLSFEDFLNPTGPAPSPQQIIASLSGMGDATRKAWLAKRPEYQKIWDSRD